ncbi:MAG: hypothetical protein PVF74_09940 [Anaerolineales bacterium]
MDANILGQRTALGRLDIRPGYIELTVPDGQGQHLELEWAVGRFVRTFDIFITCATH